MIDFAEVDGAKTLEASLFALRAALISEGAIELVYGYMVQANSHIRYDLAFVTTLSDELMDVYHREGGLNNDPVADSLAHRKEPYLIDLVPLYEGNGPAKMTGHKYIAAMLEKGLRTMWACPIADIDPVGYGSLTVFQDETPNATKLEPALLRSATSHFHNRMKRSGKLGSYFGLTKSEAEALHHSSLGKSGQWIAESADTSLRTIELRLQSARKKLKSKTTTEAVFKATAYGILRNNFR